jgi:N-acetylgalactosamine-6-sulfatase
VKSRILALVLGALGVLSVHAHAVATSKPNVIFILADDFGWGDLACYGHPYSRTPNIDKLASEGTRFLQCYATGVTCCPSRTGFMTSKFPATFAKYPASGGFGERVTITELLKKQGYATGHFGKWHIGPGAKPGTYGIDAIGSDDGGV